MVVDLLLILTNGMYLINHDEPLDAENITVPYRKIGDVCSCTYRILVIALCIRFVLEFLLGSTTDEARSASQMSYWQIYTYLFQKLELDQFTIAAVLCAAHQLYNAALLWIAVGNGANSWYIVTGFSHFAGVFSVAYPGICFKQFVYFAEKEKRAHDAKERAGMS